MNTSEEKLKADSEWLGADLGVVGLEDAEDARDAELRRLAELGSIDYDQARTAAAEKLGIRLGTLDVAVENMRRKDAADITSESVQTVTPADHPVIASEVLSETLKLIHAHIVCDKHTAVAVTLWSAMTYLTDVFDTLPLALITAPEKRCGKTRLLGVLGKLVQRPLASSNTSPAALFRSIELWTPTLLIDEADSFIKDNEELRGVINSGHTRDAAFVLRCVGEDFEPHQFSTWCPKVLSGIGSLPGTIEDRSIILRLQRKLPTQKVAPLRDAGARFQRCAAGLARMAVDDAAAIRSAHPTLPDLDDDRAVDNWLPLLAIAEVAGGDWPRLARDASLALTTSGERNSDAIGPMLLSDIRTIFRELNIERISTTNLIESLEKLDEPRRSSEPTQFRSKFLTH